MSIDNSAVSKKRSFITSVKSIKIYILYEKFKIKDTFFSHNKYIYIYREREIKKKKINLQLK